MRSLCTDVSNAHEIVAYDFPLQRQAPVLRIRRDELLVQNDGEKRCRERHVVVGGTSRENIERLAAEERPVKRTVHELHTVAERGYIIRIVLRVKRGPIEEESVTAPNAGL